MNETELYSKMYYTLFNAVTDAIELLQQGKNGQAESLLIAAQQATEEIFIEFEE